MPIVSNTSPVLNLAIVNHLSLMYEQFGEILIPQAVFEAGFYIASELYSSVLKKGNEKYG